MDVTGRQSSDCTCCITVRYYDSMANIIEVFIVYLKYQSL